MGEIAKANKTAGRIGRTQLDHDKDDTIDERNKAKKDNPGFGDPDYPNKLKNGQIDEYQLCGTKTKTVHQMPKWRKKFNKEGANTTQAWKDFAKQNYPFVVDCGGKIGQYVAVRLLNADREENKKNKETNFLNNAPLTLCEIEVEEKN